MVSSTGSSESFWSSGTGSVVGYTIGSVAGTSVGFVVDSVYSLVSQPSSPLISMVPPHPALMT